MRCAIAGIESNRIPEALLGFGNLPIAQQARYSEREASARQFRIVF
jgi:hypothetical protein